jgi:integrase
MHYAVRSFARFALTEAGPDFLPAGQRLLSIPVKKTGKPQLSFLTREEVAAILAATDNTFAGQRDHLLFTVLYNTGARISEALALRPADIRGRSVQLHGKGRKTRLVPLWPQSLRRLRRWCQLHALRPDQLIFTNTRGAPLSRSGAAFRLALTVRKAGPQCRSLASRRITPHTFRHTTAMHLLQSGVPLEVIALWLGHERPITTHAYVEADMKIKADCLRRLQPFPAPARLRRPQDSHLVAFLEAL